MSTTIDQQIVEMRFDNRQFESNVSSTMSLLDKLKQSLNFRGSGKGLESLGATANSVGSNMKQLEYNACEAGFSFRDVWLKVSNVFEYQVAGKIINAGKRMISALTIDPIKAGLDEYETKMGSIQTILANTSHQGTTLDDVTAALNELNTYSDKTIYNFQEMAKNIGTFTAAGIDLDTSVKSIQGIANLAAVSGSTSQQASTAMYQLSQALAAGTVKLMDWNSVVNAGMGGKVFQDALIRTAAMLDGSAKDVEAWQKEHVDAYGSFRESLSKEQWLTAEVLTTTLEQFTMAAEKGSDEWNAFKKTLMDKGYAEDQAEAILEMANTATNAATKVKTFSQLFDTLKETAQSGWAQTWELIIGDFEEAKEFLTGLSDMIGGFIDSMSKWRNNLLGNALNSNLDKLTEKLRGDGINSTKLEEKLRAVAKESGHTDDALDELITTHGSLAKAVKAGALPIEILRKALAALGIGTSGTNKSVASFVAGLEKVERVLGWWSIGDDVKAVQTALEALGHSVGKHGIDGIIGPDTTAAIKEFQKVAGLKIDGVVGPETLKALIDAGASLETITENAIEADASYEDLITNIAQLGGREMLLQGFSNIVNGIVGTLRAFGAAWNAIFPASGAHKGLVKAIDAFYKFSKAFKIFDTITTENGETIIQFTETGDKLVRVFKGLLAVVDIFLTVVGGPFKILLKAATQLLGYFGIGVLEGAATLGDALVKLRDFIDGTLDFTKVFDKIIPPIQNGIKKFREWIKTLKDSKDLPKDIAEGIASGIGKAFKTIKKFFTSLPKLFKNGFDGLTDNPLTSFIKKLGNGLKVAGQVFVELGKIALEKLNEFLSARGFKTISVDMIAGLIDGIKGGIGKVLSTIGELAQSLIEKVKDILGIHSPSRVFIAIGGFIIAGLVAGLLGGIPEVRNALDNITGKITEGLNALGDTDLGKTIKSIDWGKIFSAIAAGGLMYLVKRITDLVGAFASPFEAVGEILEESAKPIAKTIDGIAKVTKNFGKVLGSIAFEKKSEGIKNIAISLALVLGAIVATVVILKKFDVKPGELWHIVGLVAVLGAVLIGLSFAVAKLSGTTVDIGKNGAKLASNGPKLFGIAMALLVVAGAVALLGSMDESALKQGLIATGAIVGGLIAFIAVYGLLVKGKSAQNMDKLGKMLRKMATTLLLLVAVVKLVSLLSWGEMGKGLAFVAGFTLFVLALVGISKLAGKKVDKIGGLALKISFAMLLLIGVVKLASKLSYDEMLKGALFAAGFAGFVGALVLVTKIGKKDTLAKVGGLVLAMSFALLLMVGVVKLIGKLSPEEMFKGVLFVGAFILFVTALVAITKLDKGQRIAKISGMIFAMSVAIAILAGVCLLLGLIDENVLIKGGIAIAALGTIMAVMIRATKGAKDIKGSIYAMAIAIGILAGVCIVLGLIDTVALAKGVIAVGVLMGLFALILKTSKNANKAMGSIIALTVAMAMIAGALYLVSTIPAGRAIASAVSIGIVMGVMAGVLMAAGKAGRSAKSANKAITVLMKMCVPLLGIAAALFILGKTDPGSALAGMVALSGMLVVMAKLMPTLSAAGKKAKTASKAANVLMKMCVPLLGIAVALLLIGQVDPGSALAGMVSLSGVLLAMSGVLTILSNIGGRAKSIDSGIRALTKLLIPMVGIVAALGVLSLFPMESVAASAAALSMVLIAMGGVIAIFGVLGNACKKATSGVIAMTALLIPLVGVVGILYLMEGLDNAQKTVRLLVELMLAMSLMLGVATIAGMASAAAAPGVLAMVGVIAVFGTLAVAIGALLNEFPSIQEFLNTGIKVLVALAEGIGEAVGAFVRALATEIMQILPTLGQALTDFMNNAKGFIDGAKTIDEKVLAGVGILTAAIIALTVAEFINGVAEFLPFSSSFADLGTSLSNFIRNAMPFLTTTATIGEDSVRGVKMLAETILILTAANVLDGLASLLGAGDGFEKFATDLPKLGEGLRGFSDSLGDFTDEQLATVNCAAEAVKKLAAASAAIPNTGGLLAAIVGENDLGKFASDFPKLGTGLRGLLTNIETLTPEEVETIKCAAEAIKVLAKASSEIPNTGGLLGMLVGENDLGTFADQFPKLGTGLRGLLTNLDTLTSEEVETIKCAADAMKVLAKASSEIPNTGGLLGMLVGENDLDTFAAQFPKLGTGLRGLIDEAGTFTEAEIVTVKAAAEAIKILASAASEIPNSGGWVAAFCGDNDLGDFAKKFPTVGEGIKGFADKLGTFDDAKLATVRLGVDAVATITKLGKLEFGSLSTNMDAFSSNIEKLGVKLTSFFIGLSEVGATSVNRSINNVLMAVDMLDYVSNANFMGLLGAANAIDKLVESIQGMSKIGPDTSLNLVNTMSRLGSVTVESLALSIEKGYPKMQEAGETLLTKVSQGFALKKVEFIGKVAEIGASSAKAVSLAKSNFTSAGGDLGQGLVNGINSMKSTVYWAAYALGQQAVQGEKDGQQSNSPSKLTMKAGNWLGEGLIVGMDQMTKKVYNAGSDMGKAATNTISSAVSKIADMVNTDIDTQPTIRPVLDLTDVEAGASTIGGMFGLNPSVGVLANVGSISASMNNRQNRSNEDVVTAIDRLRKDLSDMPRSTTTIGNITYDDGTNINTAVETLVRAARIGRRR